MKTILGIGFFLVTVSAQAAEYSIVQKNKNFDKKEITVDIGDVINFKNEEEFSTHNVYSLGPKNLFELKTQAPGKISPVTFSEEGETEVECAIHPGMKLKVKVKGKKK